MARSSFPLDKPFERQEPKTPLQEIGLRLVVDFYTDQPRIVGTATVLCGSLLLTARHVFTDIVESLSRNETGMRTIEGRLSAVQTIPTPDPEYIIWDVFTATLDPETDLALLHLAANPGRSDPARAQVWKQPIVMPFAPAVGDKVAAFGYRRGMIKTTKNAAGGNHYDLSDEPVMSVGLVRDCHEWMRDSVMHPYPCYQVTARLDSGMSGGPVFNEDGQLCGIVCSNIEGSHLEGEPISYVSTLWPLFRLMLNVNRAGHFPRDVSYAAIELARAGIVAVADMPRLESWFAQFEEGGVRP